MPGPSRRELITRVAALAALPAVAGAADSPDEAALAGAEKLLLVDYTASERALLLSNFEDVLGLVRARRTFQPDNAALPASRFDPRLPGRSYGPAADEPLAPAEAPAASRDKEDLAFAPIAWQAAWLRSGAVTSQRLTANYLTRLTKHDQTLLAVVTPLYDEAMGAAEEADLEAAEGKWRGPLHGIPYGVKDLLDTRGTWTTFGAEPYEDRKPTADAVVIERLRDAGAVLVAKLSLGALAMGDEWFGGTTKNPWNPAEGSSGSSAGPASAVAAGLVGFAIGSETLGSIVSPSMRCGTTGLRPTFGRVPRTGAMALCWSLDKLGPITRTVDDAALVLSALNGSDPGDPSSLDVPLALGGPRDARGLRVGFDSRWFDGADPLDQQALDALRDAGAVLVETRLPEVPWDGLILILYAEAAAAFEALTLDGRDDRLSAQGKDAWPNLFRQARLISAVDLVQADRLRRHAMTVMDRAFADVDAFLAPSFGNPMLVATNFTGHPSLTVRTGFVEKGTRDLYDQEAPGDKHRVPHGITLWGRLFDEGTLIRLGRALEDRFAVWSARPTLPSR